MPYRMMPCPKRASKFKALGCDCEDQLFRITGLPKAEQYYIKLVSTTESRLDAMRGLLPVIQFEK
jgi:hypothetical protein